MFRQPRNDPTAAERCRRAIMLCALLLTGCAHEPRHAGAESASGGAGAGGAPTTSDGGFVAGAAAGANAETGYPSPSLAATLPLEVLGAPGVGVETSLELSASDIEAASTAKTQLVLTVQNVVEPDSATVSINDAAPIDLGATDGPWLRRHDGQVAAGAIALAPTLLRAGSNRIVFRYTRQIIDFAAVSGFRVLAVGMAIGEQHIALELPADDPNGWAPFDASAEASERGRSYFQDTSRDGGPACARCHADSGADLQYYAFSNESIAQRAMFHQFSREEAEDIASYVRSLPVVAIGRVYDAPFQPGTLNHGAAGAGYAAILGDNATFSQAAFGASMLPAALAWDWADAVDTYLQPINVATPTWMRWLPRQLEQDWFEREGGLLASAERNLAEQGSLESAQTFMSAALTVGKGLVAESGDYAAKIDVLRFAAVKLWDWSRQNGFDNPDHGMPDGSPAYPYEVGFGFFEAAASEALPLAAQQTMSWWWAQLATNPGRGLSTGKRPLNFLDVLSAAENAALGSAQIAFLHLYGSWEESRGALGEKWGSADGPVRLLAAPLRDLGAADRAALMQRFLLQEQAFVEQGGALENGHHAQLADAWSRGCSALSSAQRSALRAVAPEVVGPDLAACP
jgi:hypothetical protein